MEPSHALFSQLLVAQQSKNMRMQLHANPQQNSQENGLNASINAVRSEQFNTQQLQQSLQRQNMDVVQQQSQSQSQSENQLYASITQQPQLPVANNINQQLIEHSTQTMHRNQSQLGEEESDLSLLYPAPSISVSGISIVLFNSYLTDENSKSTLRSLRDANFTQEKVSLLSKCGLTGKEYDKCIVSLRNIMTEDDFKQNRNLLLRFIKPYVLSDFEFVVNWSGSRINANNSQLAFQTLERHLREYMENHFFDIAETNGAEILRIYNSNVPGMKGPGVSTLKSTIQKGAYAFGFEHAIYYLIKVESTGTTGSLSRRYRRYVTSKFHNAINKVQKDLYPKVPQYDDEVADDEEAEPCRQNSHEAQLESTDERNKIMSEISDADSSSSHTTDSNETGDESEVDYSGDNSESDQDIGIDGVAVGNTATNVETKELFSENMNASRSTSTNDFSIGVEYSNPLQRLIVVNCSHPLRLTFEGALFDQIVFDPTHITCIVGHMSLYAEVVLMVRCQRYKNLRTITFLQPHALKDTFVNLMQSMLGKHWLESSSQQMTYGKNKTSFVIVTFFHAQRQRKSNLFDAGRAAKLWKNYKSSHAIRRYEPFMFQTHGSHYMESKYRRKLLLETIQLEQGECCLEIGCGVPRLSLDMAFFSKATIVMLDVDEVYQNIRSALEFQIDSNACVAINRFRDCNTHYDQQRNRPQRQQCQEKDTDEEEDNGKDSQNKMHKDGHQQTVTRREVSFDYQQRNRPQKKQRQEKDTDEEEDNEKDSQHKMHKDGHQQKVTRREVSFDYQQRNRPQKKQRQEKDTDEEEDNEKDSRHKMHKDGHQQKVQRRRIVYDDEEEDVLKLQNKKVPRQVVQRRPIVCDDEEEEMEAQGHNNKMPSDDMMRIFIQNPITQKKTMHIINRKGTMVQIHKNYHEKILTDANIVLRCTTKTNGNEKLPRDSSIYISETALNDECVVSIHVLGRGGANKRSYNTYSSQEVSLITKHSWEDSFIHTQRRSFIYDEDEDEEEVDEEDDEEENTNDADDVHTEKYQRKDELLFDASMRTMSIEDNENEYNKVDVQNNDVTSGDKSVWISYSFSGYHRENYFVACVRQHNDMKNLASKISHLHRKLVIGGNNGSINDAYCRIYNCRVDTGRLRIEPGVHITFFNDVKVHLHIIEQEETILVPKHLTSEVIYEYVRKKLNSSTRFFNLEYKDVNRKLQRLPNNASIWRLVDNHIIGGPEHAIICELTQNVPQIVSSYENIELKLFVASSRGNNLIRTVSVTNDAHVADLYNIVNRDKSVLLDTFFHLSDETGISIRIMHGNQWLCDPEYMVRQLNIVKGVLVVLHLEISVTYDPNFNINNEILYIPMSSSTDAIYQFLYDKFDSGELPNKKLTFQVLCGSEILIPNIALSTYQNLLHRRLIEITMLSTLYLAYDRGGTNVMFNQRLSMEQLVNTVRLIFKNICGVSYISLLQCGNRCKVVKRESLGSSIQPGDYLQAVPCSANDPATFCDISISTRHNVVSNTSNSGNSSSSIRSCVVKEGVTSTISNKQKLYIPRYSLVQNTGSDLYKINTNSDHSSSNERMLTLSKGKIDPIGAVLSSVSESCIPLEESNPNSLKEYDATMSQYSNVATSDVYDDATYDDNCDLHDQHSPSPSPLLVEEPTASTENYVIERYVIVSHCKGVLEFPLHLPINFCYWIPQKDHRSSTICITLDSVPHLPENDFLRLKIEGFMILAVVCKGEDYSSGIEYYLIGSPREGAIVVWKINNLLQSRQIYNAVKQQLLRKSPWKNRLQCIEGGSKSLFFMNILMYCTASRWGLQCGHITNVNYEKKMAINNITRSGIYRCRLNVAINKYKDTLSSGSKTTRLRSSLKKESIRISRRQNIHERMNQYKLTQIDGVFASTLSICNILQAVDEVVKGQNNPDVSRAALGLLLFQDLRWRMKPFSPIGDPKIESLAYDIDQISVEISSLRVKSSYLSTNAFLDVINDDITMYVYDARMVPSSYAQHSKHGKGGNTYMNKMTREKFVCLPRDQSKVLRVSVAVLSVPKEELQKKVNAATLESAEYIDPSLKRHATFYAAKSGEGSSLQQFKGGHLHMLLTLALLLLWYPDGIDVVIETYGNKLHVRQNALDSLSKVDGIGRELLEQHAFNEPGLIAKLINYFKNSIDNQKAQFTHSTMKIILGVGCEVSAFHNEMALHSHVATVPCPCADALVDPKTFYYETKNKLNHSNKVNLQESKLCQIAKNWTFYPIYGMTLPVELQPLTVQKKVLQTWLSTETFESNIVRIQSYYPSPRRCEDDTEDCLHLDSSGTASLDISGLNKRFDKFLANAELHFTNLFSTEGLFSRIEVAAEIPIGHDGKRIDITEGAQQLINDIQMMIKKGFKAYNLKEFFDYQMLYLYALQLKLRLLNEICEHSDSIDRYTDIIPGLLEIDQIMKRYYSGQVVLKNIDIKAGRISSCIGRPLLHPLNNHLIQKLHMILNNGEMVSALYQRLGFKETIEWPYNVSHQRFHDIAKDLPHCCNQCYRVFTFRRVSHFPHHQCIILDSDRSSKLQMEKLLDGLFTSNLRNALSILRTDFSQQCFFNAVRNDEYNIFLTGCAGAGKTFALSTVIDWLHLNCGEGGLVILANTCLVAERLGGETIHSFFGLDFNTTLETLSTEIWCKQTVSSRFSNRPNDAFAFFNKIEYVIIDEISHISGAVLDKMSNVFSILSGSSLSQQYPFGNKRVIIAGDVLQLPPPNGHQMFYQAECFYKSQSFQVVFLQRNHRSDLPGSSYINILNATRIGKVTNEELLVINSKWGQNVCPKDILLAFALSVRLSKKELKFDELSKNHNKVGYMEQWYSLLQSKNAMYPPNRLQNLVTEDCINELRILLRRIELLHSNSGQVCTCYDETLKRFSFDSAKEFDDQIIALYKQAKQKCSCKFPPLILVTLKAEVRLGTEMLFEVFDHDPIANAIDNVYCNGQKVENVATVQTVIEKLNLRESILPMRIVVANGMTAIAMKSIKKLGLLKNGLGTIHGYATDGYTLNYSVNKQKSPVWKINWNSSTENLFNVRHTIQLERVTETYKVQIQGQEYSIDRSQFPIQSMLAVHSYVVQGQELHRPTIISFARNSQRLGLGINTGNAYCLLSRFTCPDDIFLLHSVNKNDFQVSKQYEQFDAHHRQQELSFADYNLSAQGEIIKNV